MSRNKMSRNKTKELRSETKLQILRRLYEIVGTYEDCNLTKEMAINDIKIALKELLKVIDKCLK